MGETGRDSVFTAEKRDGDRACSKLPRTQFRTRGTASDPGTGPAFRGYGFAYCHLSAGFPPFLCAVARISIGLGHRRSLLPEMDDADSGTRHARRIFTDPASLPLPGKAGNPADPPLV